MNFSTKLMTAFSLGTTLLFSGISSAAPFVSVQGGVGHGYTLDLGMHNDNNFGASARLGAGYLWNLSNSFQLG